MLAEPLGLFLTWTTYGSWLPGDGRGWSRRGRRGLPADWRRERAARELMAESACALDPEQRRLVKETIEDHCRFRTWSLHAASVRSNHVHVVVTAAGVAPADVRAQLKAWTTRRLREASPDRRRWWTEGGDIEFLDTEADVLAAAEYVLLAQDRKERDAFSE